MPKLASAKSSLTTLQRGPSVSMQTSQTHLKHRSIPCPTQFRGRVFRSAYRSSAADSAQRRTKTLTTSGQSFDFSVASLLANPLTVTTRVGSFKFNTIGVLWKKQIV